MHLSNIASAEPSLPVLIHVEVLIVGAIVPVVAHGHIGTTDEDLPTWMRLIMLRVTT